MCSINKPHRIFGIRRDRGGAREGFALIAVLIALAILTALGILVFTLSTQDVRISSKTVGEKKAFSAAESGISWLAQNFDPENLGSSAVTDKRIDDTFTALIDPNSTFTISTPAVPSYGPPALPSPGYAVGGSEVWGQTRHVAQVTGKSSNYSSRVDIDAGLGYGPVDITTLYR